jgi:hypothetical protein
MNQVSAWVASLGTGVRFQTKVRVARLGQPSRDRGTVVLLAEVSLAHQELMREMERATKALSASRIHRFCRKYAGALARYRAAVLDGVKPCEELEKSAARPWCGDRRWRKELAAELPDQVVGWRRPAQ